MHKFCYCQKRCLFKGAVSQEKNKSSPINWYQISMPLIIVSFYIHVYFDGFHCHCYDLLTLSFANKYVHQKQSWSIYLFGCGNKMSLCLLQLHWNKILLNINCHLQFYQVKALPYWVNVERWWLSQHHSCVKLWFRGHCFLHHCLTWKKNA